MKHTENINRFDKKDNGGVTLNKQYYYCLAYCYLHRVFKYTGQKNEEAMVNAGAKCATNCTVLYDAKLSHISMAFGAPFVRYLGSRETHFVLPNVNDGISSCNIEHKFRRGKMLLDHTESDDYAIIDNGENAIGLFRSSGRYSVHAHYYVYNFQHGTLDKVTCHEDGGQEYLDSSFQDNNALRLSIVKFPDQAVISPENETLNKKLQEWPTATDAYPKVFNLNYMKSQEITRLINKYARLMIGAPPEL
jgi:hypothetical protein